MISVDNNEKFLHINGNDDMFEPPLVTKKDSLLNIYSPPTYQTANNADSTSYVLNLINNTDIVDTKTGINFTIFTGNPNGVTESEHSVNNLALIKQKHWCEHSTDEILNGDFVDKLVINSIRQFTIVPIQPIVNEYNKITFKKIKSSNNQNDEIDNDLAIENNNIDLVMRTVAQTFPTIIYSYENYNIPAFQILNKSQTNSYKFQITGDIIYSYYFNDGNPDITDKEVKEALHPIIAIPTWYKNIRDSKFSFKSYTTKGITKEAYNEFLSEEYNSSGVIASLKNFWKNYESDKPNRKILLQKSDALSESYSDVYVVYDKFYMDYEIAPNEVKSFGMPCLGIKAQGTVNNALFGYHRSAQTTSIDVKNIRMCLHNIIKK